MLTHFLSINLLNNLVLQKLFFTLVVANEIIMNLAVVLLLSIVASLSCGNEGHSCTSGNSIQLLIFAA